MTPDIHGEALRTAEWFRGIDRGIYLAAGTPAPQLLRVPEKDAQQLLRETARAVADAPKETNGDVVWVAGADELLVRPAVVGLTCAAGLVTVSLPVGCDQLRDGGTVEVPFAVGTDEAPAGLVMSTLDRPIGPAVVVDGWAGALTAFAWESLVALASALSAAAGRDSAGAPLIPGYLGAERGLLLIQPMARHKPVTARFVRPSTVVRLR